jgi:hypothetical protein
MRKAVAAALLGNKHGHRMAKAGLAGAGGNRAIRKRCGGSEAVARMARLQRIN